MRSRTRTTAKLTRLSRLLYNIFRSFIISRDTTSSHGVLRSDRSPRYRSHFSPRDLRGNYETRMRGAVKTVGPRTRRSESLRYARITKPVRHKSCDLRRAPRWRRAQSRAMAPRSTMTNNNAMVT